MWYIYVIVMWNFLRKPWEIKNSSSNRKLCSTQSYGKKKSCTKNHSKKRTFFKKSDVVGPIAFTQRLTIITGSLRFLKKFPLCLFDVTKNCECDFKKKHIIKDYIYTNSILNSMGSTGDISQLNSISNAPVGVRIKFLNIFAVMM